MARHARPSVRTTTRMCCLSRSLPLVHTHTYTHRRASITRRCARRATVTCRCPTNGARHPPPAPQPSRRWTATNSYWPAWRPPSLHCSPTARSRRTPGTCSGVPQKHTDAHTTKRQHESCRDITRRCLAAAAAGAAATTSSSGSGNLSGVAAAFNARPTSQKVGRKLHRVTGVAWLARHYFSTRVENFQCRSPIRQRRFRYTT